MGYKAMENMQEIREQFLEYLKIKGYAEGTITLARKSLKYFLDWCKEREITTPHQISHASVLRYQKYLCYYRNEKTGKGLARYTQHQRLHAIKSLCQWLVRVGILSANPAAQIEYPSRDKRLPQNILTAEEVEKILDQVDVSTASGMRNRAMMETFYSTGIRRQELIETKLEDIDWQRGILRIRKGKNRKERIIPIGERALKWIERYLREARKYIAKDPDEGYLFLNILGDPLSPSYITTIAHRALKKAGIEKSGSCHIFRHTAATLMLENGADIRYIQEMLGHAWLITTQVYTKVMPNKLKEVHEKTHPGNLGFKISDLRFENKEDEKK